MRQTGVFAGKIFHQQIDVALAWIEVIADGGAEKPQLPHAVIPAKSSQRLRCGK